MWRAEQNGKLKRLCGVSNPSDEHNLCDFMIYLIVHNLQTNIRLPREYYSTQRSLSQTIRTTFSIALLN